MTDQTEGVLPVAQTYRVAWEGWHQYHDESDPLPADWDDERPEVTPLYTQEQMRAYRTAGEAAADSIIEDLRRQLAEKEAALGQASFALRELLPDHPDAHYSLRIIAPLVLLE